MWAHCFCSTYARPELVQGALALFQAQTYPKKYLTILDDSGCLVSERQHNYMVVSIPERFPSLASKFRYLYSLAAPGDKDAIFIWDDDDLYHPLYIEWHMEVLRRFPVSKPALVYVFNHLKPDDFLVYRTENWFYPSLAFRVYCLEEVTWREHEPFDLNFIRDLREYFTFGDPVKDGIFPFVYCIGPWSRMSVFRNRYKEKAYQQYGKEIFSRLEDTAPRRLVPELDAFRKEVLQRFEGRVLCRLRLRNS